MSDKAFQLLQQAMQQQQPDQCSLWLVDENISVNDIVSMKPSENLLAITNRFDLALSLRAQGFTVELSDYDFSTVAKHSLDAIFYRVSKEKSLVHHIINAAAMLLKPSACLFLAGYKSEGIKTYVDKAAAFLGGGLNKQRGGQSSLLAELRFEHIGLELQSVNEKALRKLDDKNYGQTMVVSAGNINFISKPGVYGWNKIDKGSAFLIENFPVFLQSLAYQPKSVIDLGCGFGYLSVMAAKSLAASYVATDNNIAAVDLCKKNFIAHDIAGKVVLDDAGASIKQQFDLVLCNPPFHQGFGIEGDLTGKFVTAAKRLIKPYGCALFVVNSFIPLEKKAETVFSKVVKIANNGSFKLILLAV